MRLKTNPYIHLFSHNVIIDDQVARYNMRTSDISIAAIFVLKSNAAKIFIKRDTDQRKNELIKS